MKQTLQSARLAAFVSVLALVVTGCTVQANPVSDLQTVSVASYQVDIPADLHKQSNSDPQTLALYSDQDGDTFQNYSFAVRKFPGLIQKKTIVNLAYCQKYYETLASALLASPDVAGFKKGPLKFAPAVGSFPSSCMLEFTVLNQDAKSFGASQVHYQRVLFAGADQIVFELSARAAQPTELVAGVLGSIRE